jgi:hypothetical protein
MHRDDYKISELKEEDLINGNYYLTAEKIMMDGKKNFDYSFTGRGSDDKEFGQTITTITAELDKARENNNAGDIKFWGGQLEQEMDRYQNYRIGVYGGTEGQIKKAVYQNWSAILDGQPYMSNPAADVIKSVTGYYDPFGGLFGFSGASEYMQKSAGLTGQGTGPVPSDVYQHIIQSNILSKATEENREEIHENLGNYIEAHRVASSLEGNVGKEVRENLNKTLDEYKDIVTNPNYHEYSKNAGDMLNPGSTLKKTADMLDYFGRDSDVSRQLTKSLSDEVHRINGFVNGGIESLSSEPEKGDIYRKDKATGEWKKTRNENPRDF